MSNRGLQNGTGLLAPFPYFGGKSRIAPVVWERFGDVPNLVDPFLGSNALLLARPEWDWEQECWRDGRGRIETVNDIDGFISNFWRALQHDPETVARYADWPVNENDLTARHIWLVNQRDDITSRLEGDTDYYNAKVAGWWVWGISCWIGGEWCSGKGPWQSVDGQLVHLGNAGQGVKRKLVHLGNAGQGVKRKRVHLGDTGRGVNRQQVRQSNDGIYRYMDALAKRLRHVRVCCGDWQRVLGPTPTVKNGLTAVFLDPPYDQAERDATLYAVETPVSAAVREWAISHGDDPQLRIALCGYDGEHLMPDTWAKVAWKTKGGYANQGDISARLNAARERIWFSPTCLRPAQETQMSLF